MASRNDIPTALLGGKIRLIKRIGRGGMGDVWVARNEATQAELAVKTLNRAERTPIHDERFRREARLSATISHRNVVRVFDLVDEQDGTLGLVMELLRGGTLEDIMKERGPLPASAVLAIALPVLSAMHHVHQKGIIHRDMKPANVFFAVEPDGHVIPKVLDFGIAKLPAAGSALTMDGSVLGTPHYMSPEQIRGQDDIDGRSDMFSFAVVIYEMLTGVRVFQRETASASLAAVLEHEVDPDPRIEPRLWITISRALSKRPYERYSSCAELAEALRASINVSEDELGQTLQDMRLRSEAASMSTDEASSLALSQSPVRVEIPRRWGVIVTMSIAAGAATLAVGLTLMLTMRGSSSSSSDDPLPVSASSRTGTTDRDSIPPPAVVSAAPLPTPSPSVIEPPPPATTTGRHATGTGTTPKRVTPGATPTAKPTTTPKPKGSLATTPGF